MHRLTKFALYLVMAVVMAILPFGAALTADRRTQSRGAYGERVSLPIAASTTIYNGSIVMVDAAGYAVPAADTAACFCAGIATEQVDNGDGSDGDLNVTVEFGKQFLLGATSITQAMVGSDIMEAIDDQTVDETSSNAVEVGRITEFVSVTQAWVYVPGLSALS